MVIFGRDLGERTREDSAGWLSLRIEGGQQQNHLKVRSVPDSGSPDSSRLKFSLANGLNDRAQTAPNPADKSWGDQAVGQVVSVG